MDLIDELDINETEHNELIWLLIEKDPEFADFFDRLIDEASTGLPELKNLRPQSKIGRDIKISAIMYSEYIDKGQDEVKKQLHIQTATDEDLDLFGQGVGLERITLTKATGTVLVGSSIIPDAVYTLPELFTVATTGSETQESLKFLGLTTPSIDPTTLQDADGDYTTELYVIAENGGSMYNLDPNMITEVLSKVPYFNIVKQTIKTAGGYDREEDDDYRQRVLTKKKSYIGTIEWFKSETEAFEGVQEAIITPAQYGEGSIGIAIRGTGYVIPESLLTEIQAHFDSDEIKPLANWRAFVSTISSHTVPVVVVAYHLPGQTIDQAAVQDAIETYFASLKIGESFVRIQMEKSILMVANVFNLKSTYPLDNNGIINAQANELLIAGSVAITVEEII